jgi:CheY-like chemotaxis protein
MAKVLVVDDELDIVETIRFVLESKGHEVLEANDGLEALERARRMNPDLILLDVMMPKMDGYRVCRLLKYDSQFRDIPVVMLTARTGPQDIQTGVEVGADEYLTKPFDLEEMIELVDRLTSNGKE